MNLAFFFFFFLVWANGLADYRRHLLHLKNAQERKDIRLYLATLDCIQEHEGDMAGDL